eukprot:261706-Amphidinium_carterae.1
MNGHLGHQSLQRKVTVKDGMSVSQLRDSQTRINQRSLLNQKGIGSMSESIRGHFQVEEWS